MKPNKGTRIGALSNARPIETPASKNPKPKTTKKEKPSKGGLEGYQKYTENQNRAMAKLRSNPKTTTTLIAPPKGFTQEGRSIQSIQMQRSSDRQRTISRGENIIKRKFR